MESHGGDRKAYNKYHKEVQTELVDQSYDVERKYKIFRKLIKEKLLL